jgi:transcription termination/antitermination protein NusA
MANSTKTMVLNLVESFSEFKEFKNIDKTNMMRVLEDVFRSMLQRKYSLESQFDIIINTETGDIEMYHLRLIVEDGEVEDANLQIAISDAVKLEEDYQVGEDCIEEVTLEDFGRRSVLNARQALMSRIQDLEKEDLVRQYEAKLGDIVTAEVYNIWKREILLLDDDGNELILPKEQMIPRDMFKKGETIRAIVYKIDTERGAPRILLSRTAPDFLQRLFELEVPEILEGTIQIKNIVREPGERAKVAVESYDDRIDPVGACVGVKGSRIHGIVRELRNENIDVISHTTNSMLYITRSLQPAEISRIDLDEVNHKANVFLEADQVSLAIGRGGNNIKLASKLTGYQIEVYRIQNKVESTEDDVELDEFTDEIETWVIDELKKVGLDSARSVLRASNEFLMNSTDLEEETIRDVKKILSAEFEDSGE